MPRPIITVHDGCDVDVATNELTRHGHAHRIRAVVGRIVLARDALDASSVVVAACFLRSRQRKRLHNDVGRLQTYDIGADLGVVRSDGCVGRAIVEQHGGFGFTPPLVAHRRPQRERLLKRQGAIAYRSRHH